jgi:hypothetical protein
MRVSDGVPSSQYVRKKYCKLELESTNCEASTFIHLPVDPSSISILI